MKTFGKTIEVGFIVEGDTSGTDIGRFEMVAVPAVGDTVHVGGSVRRVRHMLWFPPSAVVITVSRDSVVDR